MLRPARGPRGPSPRTGTSLLDPCRPLYSSTGCMFDEREIPAIHSRDGRAHPKKTGTPGDEGPHVLLSDLILALPAALMVGLVPGWFWTRVLLASSDLPERLAYSVGLSMV